MFDTIWQDALSFCHQLPHQGALCVEQGDNINPISFKLPIFNDFTATAEKNEDTYSEMNSYDWRNSICSLAFSLKIQDTYIYVW